MKHASPREPRATWTESIPGLLVIVGLLGGAGWLVGGAPTSPREPPASKADRGPSPAQLPPTRRAPATTPTPTTDADDRAAPRRRDAGAGKPPRSSLIAPGTTVTAVDRGDTTPEAKRRWTRARAARAAVLAERLERRLVELRRRRDAAAGADRAELDRQIALLETNLRYRRHFLAPHGRSTRPGAVPPASQQALR